MTNTSTNMPLIEVPFVDKNGNINQTWFIFLVQLFRRTGGTAGNGGASLTVGDVLALEETFAPGSAGENESLADLVLATPTRTDALVPMVSAPAAAAVPLSEIITPDAPAWVLAQIFTAGTDFTPGTTSTLTLDTSFADAAHLWVFFDGTFQGDDQYSFAGVTLTFTAPIPVGVNKVYLKGLT